MDPLQIFENFKLNTLDEKWSDEVWDNEFLSFPEPPVEYSILLGSEDMELCLKETGSTVKKWIAENIVRDEANNEERSEVSWQTLTALNINLRGLLAVLGYLMKTGQAAGADEDSRQACLSSVSLYFILLSIPGSSTYHVFHPNLYHRAIETLKLSEHLLPSKKYNRSNNLEDLYDTDHNDEMLQTEKTTLTKGLNSILFDLIMMLKTFYMKYQVRSLEITIMNLVEVTKLETGKNLFQMDNNKTLGASKTSLSYNAYVALQDLCEPRHGKVEDIIRFIMQYLMPHLYPHHLDLPLKAANIVWDTIIHFFNNLLVSKGSLAELGFETLIQHLLVKCPDRSEGRQKQASVISKLVNVCHGKNFIKSIENLIKFSFNNKILYRIFAQEIIGKLLIEMSLNVPDDEVNNREKAKIVLIGTALSRCVDSSNMVRGKAMSVIETIINSDKLSVRDILDMSEDNKEFPSEEALLNGLKTDANPLPGPNTFNSLLLDRMKDERALVRRSTMHILQNLVIHFPALLDKVTPIIGHHCRDPALSVRREAVQVLASLLQHNALHKKVLKEYVEAVLPRIYDVEIKVQEKVIETLKNLLLDKITPFTKENNDKVQYLPWRIIRQLTESKMRKNLSKICDSWIKSKDITNALIAKIQSHIGSDNDEETWVLLSALAENTKLINMKKYFEDYKKIIEGNGFITILKLEVLSNAWQSMENSYLQTLSRHILECLCKFQVSLESISICIDILSEITKYLNKSDGKDLMHSYIIELMKLSQVQIDRLTDENEEFEEECIGVYLKAMHTLGHASFLCSENVSESTLSIVQGILLDCDTVKMSIHCKERFKAAGIVLLGQQALRDRDIAEQIMPILGRLMCKESTSETLAQAAIRINAVKALADLCVRFTALVEPYLPDMCICMKDPNSLVRETIVVIFVQLLLEDYIKVKGAFFYHILTMLSDNDETIRELTIFLIKERLLVKNKTLISQSFLISIFHYNNCQTRHKFNDRILRKKERDALTLPGHKNQQKRRIIYDFMLEHLDPPSKLKILSKLNSEILEGVCEQFINIKLSEGACVLKDALYIISNDQMQVSLSSKTQDDEFQDENAAEVINPAANALSVIVEGMKKFKLSVMFPTLIKLRQFLSACKSPLLVDVSKFFIKIISDFTKDQVSEIYDEHPQLKEQIDHDISVYGKNPEVSESEFHEEPVSVEKSVIEENEDSSPKKKDLNANVSPRKKPDKPKSQASTPRKIQDIRLNNVPRIMLRRLSTLTDPSIKEWKSPPRETKNLHNSDCGSSGKGKSISSQSSTEDINTSSDFSEPESCSTPKPKKVARLSKKKIMYKVFEGTNFE